MSKDNKRVRFLDFTGGMNSQQEPFLLKENQYVEGKNVVINTGVPESRNGNTKWEATSLAYPVRSLCEFQYYDKDNTLYNYMLAACGADLYLYRNGTLLATRAFSTLDSTAWAVITAMKNKALISNGSDEPLIIDPSAYDVTDTPIALPMGIKPPTHQMVIADFAPTTTTAPTAAQDIGIATAAYTLSSGDAAKMNRDWSDNWVIPNKHIGNDYSIMLHTHINAVTDSFTLNYDGTPYLDLTKFLDTDHAGDQILSDNYDNIAFTFNLQENSSNFKQMVFTVTTVNGSAADELFSFTALKGQFEQGEWGGTGGSGLYFVKFPKTAVVHEEGSQSDTSPFWNRVKSIKIEIESYAGTAGCKASIDNLRLEESPPIPSSPEIIVDDFEVGGWKYLAGTSPSYASEFKSGRRSLDVGTITTWTSLYRTFTTTQDFAHYDNDVPVSQSDFLTLWVFNPHDTATAAFITVRFYDDTGHWVGVTKNTYDTRIDWSFSPPHGTAPFPMAGYFPPGQWQKVDIPLPWLCWTEPDGTSDVGWFDSAKAHDGADSTEMTGYDKNIDGTTNLEKWNHLISILTECKKITISFLAPAGSHLYVDRLSIGKRKTSKIISTMTSVQILYEINFPQITSFLKTAFPVVGGAIDNIYKFTASGLEWLGFEVPDHFHGEIMLGEQWTGSGISNTDELIDFDVYASWPSSVRMEIPKGSEGQVSISYARIKDFTSFGYNTVSVPGLAKYIDAAEDTVFYSTERSDSSDYITIMMMFSSVSAIDRGSLTFFSTNDTHSATYTAEIANSVPFDPVPGRDSTAFAKKMKNYKWYKAKVPKYSFIHEGDAEATWETITGCSIVVSNSSDESIKVWVDSIKIEAEGALKGEYFYKVVYRGDSLQSAPSLASLPASCSGEDVLLNSIPVSDDPRVKYRDIYRIGGGVSEYRLVETLGNSGTYYLDRKMDDELGSVLDPDYQQPPIAKYGWTHCNRYFLANVFGYNSRVYWSRPFIPEAFPTNNFIDIDSQTYGQITGGISRGEDMLVFKDKAIYRVVEKQEAGKTVYYFDNISKTIGCDAPRTICNQNGVVYFMWRKKPYRVIGGQVDEVFGEVVKATFATMDDTTATACYHNNRIFFAIRGTSTSTLNDTLVTYNTLYKCWEGYHTGTGCGVQSMTSTLAGKLVGGGSATSTNYLWELLKPATYLDNVTTGITSNVQTRAIAGVEKRLEGQRFETTVKHTDTAGCTLTIQPVVDYTAKLADTFALNVGTYPQFKSIPINGQDIGGFIGFNVGALTTTGTWKLLSATLELENETDQ